MDEMTLFKKLSEAQRSQGYIVELLLTPDCWQCVLRTIEPDGRNPVGGTGHTVLTALNDAVSMKRKREANDAEAAYKRHAG